MSDHQLVYSSNVTINESDTVTDGWDVPQNKAGKDIGLMKCTFLLKETDNKEETKLKQIISSIK